MKTGDFLYCHKDVVARDQCDPIIQKGLWYKIEVSKNNITMIIPTHYEPDEDGIMTITDFRYNIPSGIINKYFYTKKQLRQIKLKQLKIS